MTRGGLDDVVGAQHELDGCDCSLRTEAEGDGAMAMDLLVHADVAISYSHPCRSNQPQAESILHLKQHAPCLLR